MRGKFLSIIAWLSAVLIFYCVAPAFAYHDKTGERTLASLRKIKNRVSFAVVGDSQGGDKVYRRLLDRAIAYKPNFIIHLGDRIGTPGSLGEWARFRRNSDTAGILYFFVIGNHDVSDRKTEQAYTEMTDMPGNRLYYSFAAGKSLFVVLDTCLAGEGYKITGQQYQWLEKVLDNSRGYRFKFIFLHHPLYPEKGLGIHYGDSLDKYHEERDRLQALFVKHKVDVVFAAHEHLYLRKKVGGIYHIISGGGGAQLYSSEKNGGFFHFIVADIDGDKAGFNVVDRNGLIRDSFSLVRK